MYAHVIPKTLPLAKLNRMRADICRFAIDNEFHPEVFSVLLARYAKPDELSPFMLCTRLVQPPDNEFDDLQWIVALDAKKTLLGFAAIVRRTIGGISACLVMFELVARTLRRRGIGSMLLRRAETEATHYGCPRIMVDMPFDDPARKFVLGKGYGLPNTSQMTSAMECLRSSDVSRDEFCRRFPEFVVGKDSLASALMEKHLDSAAAAARV